MIEFHSEDYVEFLRRINPDNSKTLLAECEKCIRYFLLFFDDLVNLGENTDCPAFPGLYDFCQLYTGGSIDGAMKLNHGMADICINWSGGLHHAKKCEASGFCYINDIVLAILELLKYHARVLYIDIDIHHGDGVEEAFYTTDRVMTVSFHKFGEFFPGTGDIVDVGYDRGQNYSVNFPLGAGIDDESFMTIFKPVISKVMEVYKPGAIVLQCGADSLTGDRLGCFNLTLKGHGEAVKYVKSFGIPLLVLGGGGYNIRNVARCWTFETAVLLDEPISDNIPFNDYYQYYAPDFCLHLQPAAMSNDNPAPKLKEYTDRILQNLGSLIHAPSVQMHQVPRDIIISDFNEDEIDSDSRVSSTILSRSRHPGEFYNGDKDQDRALDPEAIAGS